MKSITLENGRVINIHEPHDLIFVTNLDDTGDMEKRFEEINKGEGLVVCRVRENYPCNAKLLVEKVAKGNNFEGFLWHRRPDKDTSPVCVELVILK